MVQDLEVLINFAEERNVIYSNNVFTCSNCNLEGNKALVFGHVLNSVNRDCKIEDIWYKSESTMEELISNFNNKITQLNEELQELKAPSNATITINATEPIPPSNATEPILPRVIQPENDEID